jgi:Arm DNA-binding domain
VASKGAPGYCADGGGLYLQVSHAGTKSWIFRFARNAREMGLGALHTIALADARTRAQACCQLLLDGFDPLTVRDQQKLARAASSAKTMTFSECAIACIKSQKAKWTNAKHAPNGRLRSTLTLYPPWVTDVAEVDTGLVLEVLEPIWVTKHETATHLRQRIEAVLN